MLAYGFKILCNLVILCFCKSWNAHLAFWRYLSLKLLGGICALGNSYRGKTKHELKEFHWDNWEAIEKTKGTDLQNTRLTLPSSWVLSIVICSSFAASSALRCRQVGGLLTMVGSHCRPIFKIPLHTFLEKISPGSFL